jgi:hypothetical protein
MKTRTLTGLLAFLLAMTCPAGPYAASDSHRQAVARLFELTHMQRLIEDSVDGVLALQIAQNPALAEKGCCAPSWKNTSAARSERRSRGNVSEPSRKGTRHDECLYSSPTGQKVLQRRRTVRWRNQLAMRRLQGHVASCNSDRRNRRE